MNVQTVKKNKLPLLIHREEKLAIRNQKQCILQSLYKKNICVVHFLKGEEAPVKRIHYLVSACRFLSQSYFSFVAFTHLCSALICCCYISVPNESPTEDSNLPSSK